MKHFVLLLNLFLSVCFLYYGCTQREQEIKLKTGTESIRLSIKYDNYVNPKDLELIVEHSYAFISEDGKDYAVIVRNANEFMDEVENNFTVRANDTGPVRSFTIRDIGQGEYEFEIYCLTEDEWPDAPPRIVISVQ